MGNDIVNFRGFEAKVKDSEFMLIFKKDHFVLEKLHRKINNLKRDTSFDDAIKSHRSSVHTMKNSIPTDHFYGRRRKPGPRSAVKVPDVGPPKRRMVECM